MGSEIPDGMKTIIEAERLKSRILGLEDGFSASDREITELKERIATLEAQLTEAREQREEARERLATKEMEHRETIAASHTVIETLKAQLSAMQKPVTEEEYWQIVGPDRIPGDASFRIAAKGFADALIASRTQSKG